MSDPPHLPNVFHACAVRPPARGLVATGFSDLDQALGGGWPHPLLMEVMPSAYGIGELRLLIPLLRARCAEVQQSLIVWLNPPYSPNAVALAQHDVYAQHWVASALCDRDVLWSAEKALRSKACAAVLAWCTAPSTAALRRLRLAATECGCVCILFRSSTAASQSSPAHLRLMLSAEADHLLIEVIKHEGRMPRSLRLDVRTQSDLHQP